METIASQFFFCSHAIGPVAPPPPPGHAPAPETLQVRHPVRYLLKKPLKMHKNVKGLNGIKIVFKRVHHHTGRPYSTEERSVLLGLP